MAYTVSYFVDGIGVKFAVYLLEKFYWKLRHYCKI